jgi:hypothetical protein
LNAGSANFLAALVDGDFHWRPIWASPFSHCWNSAARDSSCLRCADHYTYLECPSIYSKTRARNLQFP